MRGIGLRRIWSGRKCKQEAYPKVGRLFLVKIVIECDGLF